MAHTTLKQRYHTDKSQIHSEQEIENKALQKNVTVGPAYSPAEAEAERLSALVSGTPLQLEPKIPAPGIPYGATPSTPAAPSASNRAGSADSSPGASENTGLGGGIIQRSPEIGVSDTRGLLSSDFPPEPGNAPEETAKRNIGAQLGADFSNVRIHNDPSSHERASGIGAKAFTQGSDIYFGQGHYSPGTATGNHLLAHELVHTIQQGVVAQSGNGIPVQSRASANTIMRKLGAVDRFGGEEGMKTYTRLRKIAKASRASVLSNKAWEVMHSNQAAEARARKNMERGQPQDGSDEPADAAEPAAVPQYNPADGYRTQEESTGKKETKKEKKERKKLKKQATRSVFKVKKKIPRGFWKTFFVNLKDKLLNLITLGLKDLATNGKKLFEIIWAKLKKAFGKAPDPDDDGDIIDTAADAASGMAEAADMGDSVTWVMGSGAEQAEAIAGGDDFSASGKMASTGEKGDAPHGPNDVAMAISGITGGISNGLSAIQAARAAHKARKRGNTDAMVAKAWDSATSIVDLGGSGVSAARGFGLLDLGGIASILGIISGSMKIGRGVGGMIGHKIKQKRADKYAGLIMGDFKRDKDSLANSGQEMPEEERSEVIQALSGFQEELERIERELEEHKKEILEGLSPPKKRKRADPFKLLTAEIEQEVEWEPLKPDDKRHKKASDRDAEIEKELQKEKSKKKPDETKIWKLQEERTRLPLRCYRDAHEGRLDALLEEHDRLMELTAEKERLKGEIRERKHRLDAENPLRARLKQDRALYGMSGMQSDFRGAKFIKSSMTAASGAISALSNVIVLAAGPVLGAVSGLLGSITGIVTDALSSSMVSTHENISRFSRLNEQYHLAQRMQDIRVESDIPERKRFYIKANDSGLIKRAQEDSVERLRAYVANKKLDRSDQQPEQQAKHRTVDAELIREQRQETREVMQKPISEKEAEILALRQLGFRSGNRMEAYLTLADERLHSVKGMADGEVAGLTENQKKVSEGLLRQGIRGKKRSDDADVLRSMNVPAEYTEKGALDSGVSKILEEDA